jgi:hypothetical protein
VAFGVCRGRRIGEGGREAGSQCALQQGTALSRWRLLGVGAGFRMMRGIAPARGGTSDFIGHGSDGAAAA